MKYQDLSDGLRHFFIDKLNVIDGTNESNKVDDDIERIITSYDPSGKAHPEESMDAPNGVSNG